MTHRRRGSRRPLPLLVRPLQEFLATETAGGALLLAATALALLWANAAGGSYSDLWGTRVALDIRAFTIDETLTSWTNDGLMAVFFFVVGLEIKRELFRGELADARKAALPVVAAIGGMVVPAAIFLSLNAGRDGARGWGIPMATDIAFAVGVLSLAGTRVPLSLKVFLLALAIVDDIGAITVIAIFYTDSLALGWLAGAVVLFAVTYGLGLLGVRHVVPYLAMGVVAWLAMHESGVHATIAGLTMGLLVPASAAGEDSSLVYRLEHILHPWTSYLVVPIFALANAGIAIDGSLMHDAASSPVSLGVALGLMLGKPLGITLFAFVGVKLGIAALPDDVRWVQLGAVAMVAGIGFTVSLFVTGLAFADAALVDDAKLGILVGSMLIGVCGLIALHLLDTESREIHADSSV